MLSNKQFKELEADLIRALFALGWSNDQALNMLTSEYGSSTFCEWDLIIREVRKNYQLAG